MMLSLIAWLVALPAVLLTAVFVTEVALGLRGPRSAPGEGNQIPVGTVILIPAHDEELGIGAMLAQLLADLPPQTDVLVVADNCSDATAVIARQAGVEVIERHDPERRGKGYALGFGRDHLSARPPDCVIVLDADCEAEPGALQAIAEAANASCRPVQATYLLRPDPAAPPMVQVSNFAMAVKNSIRQRGLSRLGAPVALTGTGMAFPWRLFAPLPLATASLAEDLEIGIELTSRGHSPRHSPAVVWSEAAGGSATLVQRSRWEGGIVAMAKRYAVPLIWRGLTRLNWPSLSLGLHLATPPVALLLFVNLAALLIAAMLALAGATAVPFVLLLLIDAAMLLALIAAWHVVGRAYLSSAAALCLPLYALWKIPIYLKLFRGGDKQWVRTERSP